MRILLILLLGILSAAAGEHRHFDMPVGPDGRMATVHAYVFQSSQEELRVIDQGGGHTPRYQNLGAACEHSAALAGVTGSFTARGAELPGQSIAGGEKRGTPRLDDPLSAGLLLVAGGKPTLKRAAAGDFTQPDLTELLQSGPLLIENGKAIPNLQPSRFGRRTFIATDGKGRWALCFVPGATLEGLATALAVPGAFPPFTPQSVLNLASTGGSGFWVRRHGGSLFYLKEISPVANFIVVVPRQGLIGMNR